MIHFSGLKLLVLDISLKHKHELPCQHSIFQFYMQTKD